MEVATTTEVTRPHHEVKTDAEQNVGKIADSVKDQVGGASNVSPECNAFGERPDGIFSLFPPAPVAEPHEKNAACQTVEDNCKTDNYSPFNGYNYFGASPDLD